MSWQVCVVGLGYVGLPTACVMALAGHDVLGVDIDPSLVADLASGRSRFHEPGLDQALHDALASGRFQVSTNPRPADAFVIAVPTPVTGLARKHADLTAVMAAGASIGTVLKAGDLVVLESTCPPGTTALGLRDVLERSAGLKASTDFSLAHCPERVLPGRIMDELVHNDRVVGGVDRASAERTRALYGSFVQGEIVTTDATTAELVKLMENTHRNVNIALANEFALVAEQLGVDAWEAISLANRHPRVQFLKPGPGVGGHCIAIDPWFVVESAPAVTPLISLSHQINDQMPRHVVDLIARAIAPGRLSSARIVVLGLTYKANVDDRRESPSTAVIEHLQRLAAEVAVHDAMVRAEPDVTALAANADCLVLLVDHGAYQDLDPARLRSAMRRPIIVDTRGFVAVDRWRAAGFDVVRLGDGRGVEISPRTSAVPPTAPALGRDGQR